jgi:dGTPase
MQMLAADQNLLNKVAEKCQKDIGDPDLDSDRVLIQLHQFFGGVKADDVDLPFILDKSAKKSIKPEEAANIARAWAASAFTNSEKLRTSGYERTAFTSALVNSAVRDVCYEVDPDCPALSEVKIDKSSMRIIAILKHFVYLSVIEQSRLKIVESRGKEIIIQIFERLMADKKGHLLPPDFRDLFLNVPDSERPRVVADFIACMTDRYAIDYYNRLFSARNESLFKEL